MPHAHEGACLSEQDIVAAARDGCVQSFDLLFRRYHPRILSYLTRRVGDRELAADLTQQTFLDAFQCLSRLADDRPFAPWLYRIAHNHLLHVWRSRINCILSLDLLLSEGQEDHARFHSPDQTSQCNERDVIHYVLNSLSPALCGALVLSALYGFSSPEVAQILAITPDAARQRIARAKEAFRQHYRSVE